MRIWISAALAAGFFGLCANAAHAVCDNSNSDESCVGSVVQAPYAAESQHDDGPPASLLGFQSSGRGSVRANRYRRGAERRPYSAGAYGKLRRTPVQAEEKAPPSNENFPVKLFESKPEDARAEMPATEASAVGASPLPDVASAASPPLPSVVPSDELNELDRAAGPSHPAPAQPPLDASPGTQNTFAFLAAFAESLTDKSTNDNTSIIGRMFIGFGVLLTAATALRLILA
jgi:hypothetical protein